MKIKKDYVFDIRAEFGSVSQVDMFETSLKAMLQALEIYSNNSHKDNKINIILDIK